MGSRGGRTKVGHIYTFTPSYEGGGGGRFDCLALSKKNKGGGVLTCFNNKIHTGYDRKEPIAYQIYPSHEAAAHVSSAQSLKSKNPPVAPLKLLQQQTGHKGLISELQRALKKKKKSSQVDL